MRKKIYTRVIKPISLSGHEFGLCSDEEHAKSQRERLAMIFTERHDS
jgi:hypothetical protein